MTVVVSNEPDLDLVSGGPSRRLLERLGLISIPKRIVWAIALTWVPLLILSVIQGRALGPSPRESFLLDFAAYGRFLLTVPLLIAAEAVVGPRLATAGKLFTRSGIVQVRDAKVFERAVAEAARWRDSAWAEGILLAIVIALGLVGSSVQLESLHAQSQLSWRVVSAPGGERLSLAGLWLNGVALPLFRFLCLRWLWRLIVWTRFLRSMSKLDLALVPTHADAAGGLGFLGSAHTTLGMLACALGWPFAGDIAFRLLYEGEKFQRWEIPLAVYLLACLLMFLSPLVVFLPNLVRARREAMRSYGLLVDDYNRAFHEKWAEGRAPRAESLLGTADIQSLADLGNAYDRIKQMGSLPFGRKTITTILGLALLPALPLAFIALPLVEIVKLLGKAVFGS